MQIPKGVAKCLSTFTRIEDVRNVKNVPAEKFEDLIKDGSVLDLE